MDDDAVRKNIVEQMISSNIVEKQEKTIIHTHNGREYLVLVTVVDLTDWPTKSDE
jgi:hemin uptake protein HemP